MDPKLRIRDFDYLKPLFIYNNLNKKTVSYFKRFQFTIVLILAKIR
jgi:hypothetical protein